MYLHVVFCENCVRKRMKAAWLILLALLFTCLLGTGYGGSTEHTDENHRSFDIPKWVKPPAPILDKRLLKNYSSSVSLINKPSFICQPNAVWDDKKCRLASNWGCGERVADYNLWSHWSCYQLYTEDIHSTSEQVIITVFPFFILSVASQLAAA